MTSEAHASGFDRFGQPHDREARLLMQLLRTSRLALLYADGGADKTGLLRLGLMPLLGRRASDELVPTAVRSSGVVVPFPDRRGRSSIRAWKRRREMVVCFADWTETPLVALRDALHLATATAPAEQLAPSMRLSEVLDDLSRRRDAHLIVLLDRFEDFLQARSQGFGHTQFANELAEAINLPELPASFLIAVNEDARPRLASLRARIPGFDDFSLKLAPAREFKAPAAPRIVKAPEPRAGSEDLPILTEAVVTPSTDRAPAPTGVAPSSVRSPHRPKAKTPKLPRVEIRTADVYAMIEEALSRIAAKTVRQAPDARASGDHSPSQSPTPSDSRPRPRGQELLEAIERMEHRLSALPPHHKA